MQGLDIKAGQQFFWLFGLLMAAFAAFLLAVGKLGGNSSADCVVLSLIGIRALSYIYTGVKLQQLLLSKGLLNGILLLNALVAGLGQGARFWDAKIIALPMGAEAFVIAFSFMLVTQLAGKDETR